MLVSQASLSLPVIARPVWLGPVATATLVNRDPLRGGFPENWENSADGQLGPETNDGSERIHYVKDYLVVITMPTSV